MSNTICPVCSEDITQGEFLMHKDPGLQGAKLHQACFYIADYNYNLRCKKYFPFNEIPIFTTTQFCNQEDSLVFTRGLDYKKKSSTDIAKMILSETNENIDETNESIDETNENIDETKKIE